MTIDAESVVTNFDGESTASAVFWQEVAKLRLEDARAWTALLAQLDTNLAQIDIQIGQESQLIRAKQVTLREQRGAKRQELERKIQSHIDHLYTMIAHRRAELADNATEARAKIVAQITILEATITVSWQQLEASWHTQQTEWQHDLQAMQVRAAQATAATRASVDAQIAALETRRQAALQEWDQRKHATAAAVQDLNAGAHKAWADLRQARANAATEFK